MAFDPDRPTWTGNTVTVVGVSFEFTFRDELSPFLIPSTRSLTGRIGEHIGVFAHAKAVFVSQIEPPSIDFTTQSSEYAAV